MGGWRVGHHSRSLLPAWCCRQTCASLSAVPPRPCTLRAAQSWQEKAEGLLGELERERTAHASTQAQLTAATAAHGSAAEAAAAASAAVEANRAAAAQREEALLAEKEKVGWVGAP